jgi:hypothetical protein
MSEERRLAVDTVFSVEAAEVEVASELDDW